MYPMTCTLFLLPNVFICIIGESISLLSKSQVTIYLLKVVFLILKVRVENEIRCPGPRLLCLLPPILCWRQLNAIYPLPASTHIYLIMGPLTSLVLC